MKNLQKILTVAVVVALLAACNDKLDNTNPSTSVGFNSVLTTPSGVLAVRASMLDRLHSFDYTTIYFLAPSALADGLVNRATTNRLNGQVTNTAAVVAGSWAGQGQGPLFNGNAYDLINDANTLIHNISSGVISKADSAQYVGEALFMRAFAYHHLVRDYAYEPGMSPSTGQGAGFQMGVIIRLQPTQSATDASQFRPRSTVSQVYDQIRSDLKKSIKLLTQQQAGPTFVPTVAAAQALMARVQLYARNYADADKFATQSLANTSAKLVSGEAVGKEFDETAGLNPEAIFVITTNPNTESLGVNNSLAVYTSTQYNAVVPTQDLMNLYKTNDARLGWYAPCFDEFNNQDITNCQATNPGIANGKKGIELEKWASESNSQFADDYPFFRVPEMLLIQSEARLHTGGDALGPINKLRVSRNLQPLSSVDIDDILTERRREFAGEGQRYWDLKRLGRTIRKAPESENGTIQPVPYTDHRILDRIPIQEVALSEQNAPQDSVLKQNPGY